MTQLIPAFCPYTTHTFGKRVTNCCILLFLQQLCGRTLRVDHVREYRRPKDEDGNEIIEKGCAPKTPTPSPTPSPEPESSPPKAKKRKLKDKTKEKKKKDKKAKKKHRK